LRHHLSLSPYLLTLRVVLIRVPIRRVLAQWITAGGLKS
jgi:hypothetical protein